MKVYIDSRTKDKQTQYGLTIYDGKGRVIDSYLKLAPTPQNKFEGQIEAFLWGIKKLNALVQNNKIDRFEPITLFTASKTLYTWFEKEVAPEPYTIRFSDVLLETNFLINPTELILSANAEKRVKYKNLVEDKPIKLTDLFGVKEG